MLAFIKSLPELIKIILVLVKAFKEISLAQDRAERLKEIKHAITKSEINGDTSDIESFINSDPNK